MDVMPPAANGDHVRDAGGAVVGDERAGGARGRPEAELRSCVHPAGGQGGGRGGVDDAEAVVVVDVVSGCVDRPIRVGDVGLARGGASNKRSKKLKYG